MTERLAKQVEAAAENPELRAGRLRKQLAAAAETPEVRVPRREGKATPAKENPGARPRTHRIAGQAPQVRWQPNPGAEKRSIEDAIAIARRHGVEIPDDVMFIEDEIGRLSGTLEDMLAGRHAETAKGPVISEDADGYVYWRDHFNPHGKIVFMVNPAVLTSDEAIVAVFTHELYELQHLREHVTRSKRKRMTGERCQSHVGPNIRGNLHDQAWDAADAAVRRMRGEG